VSIKRLRETFKHLRQYRQLFLYLIAYLIYNDGIGTIITQATIYGTELGFGTVELVLALLLVQFVGIPFSLVFGRLPDKNEKRRPLMTAFIVINAIALPIIGILLSRVLPTTITGQPPEPYVTTATHLGENEDGYLVTNAALVREGTWAEQTIEGKTLIGEGVFAQLAAVLTGTPDDATYAITTAPGDAITFNLNGQELELTYAVGPNNGIIGIEVDGKRLVEPTDEDAGVPQYVTIDTYNPTLRYGDTETITLDAPGQYAIRLVNLDEKNADSTGNDMAIARLDVLPPIRLNSLLTIFGLLIGVEIVCFAIAFAVKQFFVGLAESLDTRRSILLSLVIYSIIATWGFFLNSTIEFWFLAWMVAIVQGGSQALSRSLYAQLTPKSKSGEFFGLFSIMEKFSSIIGPLLFAFAALTLGSSRPAILSLIVLFVIGGYLLTRVNISEGQQSAREEDAEILHST
jgi:MFS family permease